MKKLIVSILASALLMGTAFAADEKEGKIQQRKENQQKRIGQGVKNGSLTPHETARLEHKETKLNKEVRHDRKENGGNLTNKEKAQVNRQQNRLSKQIYKQKHDAQTQK
jgi:Ni/Co efflux regulator RcnB